MAPRTKATPPKSHPYFKPGTVIEISSDDPGFRGSWYAGTVVRRASTKEPAKFLVEYVHLFDDDAGKKPLREIVDEFQLRPEPPRDKDRCFKFSEEVDAYYNDGWWEGVITEELGNERFSVFFRGSREQLEFGKKDLRLHREWVNGVWKPPLEEEEMEDAKAKEEEKVSAEEEPKSKTPEKFSEGSSVEVSSDEDGFQGAWFGATIIEARGEDKYLIEYHSLRTEDDLDFLREEIDTLHIRPRPPETVMVDRYNKLDEVDAMYNDGWWVGVISKVLINSRYIVYFRDTSEELEFEHSQLRLHKDWIDGKWVIPSRALKL